MSKLDELKNNRKLKQYFRDKLEMDDEEFERRFQLYLEIFPFIALDFRLKEDCHFIHQTAQILSHMSNGHSHNTSIKKTSEVDLSYSEKAESYRKSLEDIRESMTNMDIEINMDGS